MNRPLHSPMGQQGKIQADELLVKPIALLAMLDPCP